MADGELTPGALLTAAVDPKNRYAASQAHTATHVLHAVLRKILGPTAVQAGSFNKPGYLRFDFNAPKAVSSAQQQEIEGLSNEAIADDLEVTSRLMPLEDAKALGAMAMFGEKYPPIVRMVEMVGLSVGNRWNPCSRRPDRLIDVMGGPPSAPECAEALVSTTPGPTSPGREHWWVTWQQCSRST